ncbi:uncharacterized protein [Euphorbia lathyris]|uniref:uncharacterized protein isoform X2 n=1 Tax=Euphorbia lathyris TaxID=212925 RepID=UPI00331351EF
MLPFPCFFYFCTFKFSKFTKASISLNSSNILQISSNQMVSLKEIVPSAQTNINTKLILLEKSKTVMEGANKTCLTLVADETAAVHFQLWGDECDAFEPGDILRLINGIFSYTRNNLLLRAGKRGRLEKLGDFTMTYVETPNLSEIRWVPDPNNSKIYVKEAVISTHSRIFAPST